MMGSWEGKRLRDRGGKSTEDRRLVGYLRLVSTSLQAPESGNQCKEKQSARWTRNQGQSISTAAQGSRWALELSIHFNIYRSALPWRRPVPSASSAPLLLCGGMMPWCGAVVL